LLKYPHRCSIVSLLTSNAVDRGLDQPSAIELLFATSPLSPHSCVRNQDDGVERHVYPRSGLVL